MNLYFLRHGIAVEPGTAGCRRDSERPLTPEGRRKLARGAGAMTEMEIELDLILASPYVRARQTAEIVARQFHAEQRLAFSDALAVDGDPRRLIEGIRACEPAPENVLLVGHEPYLSGLISVLVFGSASGAVVMKKGGLAKLVTESLKYGRCAALEWLLTPKQMALMD